MTIGELKELIKGRDQDAPVWLCACHGDECGPAVDANTDPEDGMFVIFTGAS